MIRYSKVSIVLHWIIAALVLANIGLAELTEDLSREARGPYMDVHKAFGISMLALTIVLIVWRLRHKAPALPETMKLWERRLARIVHTVFYALLLILPLSGWIWMSTYPASFAYFGLVDVPLWPVAGQEGLGDILHETHEIVGKAMIVLVALHILGAMKHLIIDKDGSFRRMLPGGQK